MKISFSGIEFPDSGAIVVGVLEGRGLTPSAAALDRQCRGLIRRAMENSRFKGAKDQMLVIEVPARLKAHRLVLAGLGKAGKIDVGAMQALGGRVVAKLNSLGDKTAAIAVDAIDGVTATVADMAANVAFGARLRSYRFDKYRTKEKREDKPSLRSLKVMVEAARAARDGFQPLDKVADGVFTTRDLVSEPANVIYPETLADTARGLADLGVDVEVMGEARMREMGMGALLGVAQGSSREPQLVVMRWEGAPKGNLGKPVAFVGKGVTFDTGGISIKPSGGMEDMKWDMGGAGVVIGLMKALAGRNARVDAVGVIGLVENMPSGTAQRPGDVVTSMSGQTIEVINTDAEGRLVLADALWYTHKTFKPRFMVDLATLTGAIIVSLGDHRAGLFSNNDALAARLGNAGDAVGELVWRLPIDARYDKDIKSEIADMKNVGAGRSAGSISAAKFLQRFTGDVPWAHLDIAGVTWSSKDAPVVPKGGTGFGVRLLDRLVADHYES